MSRLPHLSISLHGLRAQVLLWIVLPVTLIMIVFSLTGIQSHQNSMQALAVEENTRLVLAYARVIAIEVENYGLRHAAAADPSAALPSLRLNDLLVVDHPHTITSFALLNADGTIVYARGEVPAQAAIRTWPGVAEALTRVTGSLFATDSEHGDIVAYTPVANTPWVLLIREPWHSTTDPLIRFEQAMPFILLTAVVTSLLILFFGLRYLVRPLRQLSVAVGRVGHGDFRSLELSIGGVKEIEDLRGALNEMAARVQTYQSALHRYLAAMTTAQEDERARLSRELHDETVQTLIALGHKAQMAQRSYQRGSAQTEALIAELRTLIAQAIEEVRRFSQALRPIYLEDLGLLTALEMLTREAETAELRITGTPRRLPPEKETILYRVAQEGINNARRHAHADCITLHLTFEDTRVSLQITDDGVGFPVPGSFVDLTQHGHFGLMGMYERALHMGARFAVRSAPGAGTTVMLTLAA